MCPAGAKVYPTLGFTEWRKALNGPKPENRAKNVGDAFSPYESRFACETNCPFVRSVAIQNGPGATFARVMLGDRLYRLCPSGGIWKVGVQSIAVSNVSL